MNLKLYFAVITLSYLSTCLPAFALGNIGHQVICQLSYDLLPQDKQLKVDQILLKLTTVQKTAINQFTHNKPNDSITFAKSCTWADAIKKDKRFASFNTWHYINIPRDISQIKTITCQNNCITHAINFHQQQLSVNNTQEQLLALMFLGHWLGDIHQPLHVSFASDLGGNKSKIVPVAGRCNNLHWYWDECLLYPFPTKANLTTLFDFEYFKEALYLELSKQLRNAPQDIWRNSTVIDWANESLDIIRTSKFHYCQIKEQKCEAQSKEIITLTQAYHLEYQQVLHQRMLQASVRLTNLIMQAL